MKIIYSIFFLLFITGCQTLSLNHQLHKEHIKAINCIERSLGFLEALPIVIDFETLSETGRKEAIKQYFSKTKSSIETLKSILNKCQIPEDEN